VGCAYPQLLFRSYPQLPSLHSAYRSNRKNSSKAKLDQQEESERVDCWENVGEPRRAEESWKGSGGERRRAIRARRPEEPERANLCWESGESG